MVWGILENEYVIISDDMNGHLGRDRIEYRVYMEIFCFEEMNEIEEKVFDFTDLIWLAVMILWIVNTYFFQKRENFMKLIIVERIQIDFIILRR